MSDRSAIEWTDATWPVVAGCERISPGCAHCYAVRDARRLAGNPNQKVSRVYAGTVERQGNGQIDWTGLVRPLPERLDWPLKWRKPRRVFVCNESDLFHEDVPDDFIARVFAVMAMARRHTFQLLTKRPERMQSLVPTFAREHIARDGSGWPLPNVHLGVSVENQHFADVRIPLLLTTPAVVRFISAEPLLGPIDLRALNIKAAVLATLPAHQALRMRNVSSYPSVFPLDALTGENAGGDQVGRLDWVIVGGESGPKARPCDVAWIRSIVKECCATRIPVFVKQLGSRPECGSCLDRAVCWCAEGLSRVRDRKGGDVEEWPEDLRVRAWPEVRA